MSSLRKVVKYEGLRTLEDAGWELRSDQNHIAPNSGSETDEHLALKAVAANVLLDAGYRVASEVSHDERGEIDVLGYGNPDREMLCLEIETDPDREAVMDKLNRYVDGTPISRMFIIDVADVALDTTNVRTYIKEETGL